MGIALGESSGALGAVSEEAVEILAFIVEKEALVIDPIVPSTTPDLGGHQDCFLGSLSERFPYLPCFHGTKQL